ncbi:hypothetical protein ACQEVB_35660 [Pseudonocardia sp. CA-107938]|uniref:hypothetical protein n=1 Tax=Pseudonocardia sp. CA-107938 TaxID=3240021 RepID=UPI003D92813C
MKLLRTVGDRLLEVLAPRATAAAGVKCTERRCACVSNGIGTRVMMYELWDELHGTRCGPCNIPHEIC